MHDDPGLERLGVRELRAQVAAAVRRAGTGQRIVVTVDGHPVAQLGPLTPPGAPTLDDLVASGLVSPPRRAERPHPPDPLPVAVDLRLDRLVEELRGP